MSISGSTSDGLLIIQRLDEFFREIKRKERKDKIRNILDIKHKKR